MASTSSSDNYSCCVEFCEQYNKTPYEQRHFVKFPLLDKALLKLWIKALTINKKYILPDKHTAICNAHFKRKDYAVFNRYMKLHARAIPSVFGYIGNTKQNFITVNIDTAPLTNVQPDKQHIELFVNHENGCVKITNVQGKYVKSDIQVQLQQDMGFKDDYLIRHVPNPPMAIDVHLDKTVKNNHSIISSKKTNTPKTNKSHLLKIVPRLLKIVPPEGDGYPLSKVYLNELAKLKKQNENLTYINKYLILRNTKMQDALKEYLTLKNYVLDAEKKLLMKGIDTSEYSLFQYIHDELKPQQKDNQHDVLFETK